MIKIENGRKILVINLGTIFVSSLYLLYLFLLLQGCNMSGELKAVVISIVALLIFSIAYAVIFTSNWRQQHMASGKIIQELPKLDRLPSPSETILPVVHLDGGSYWALHQISVEDLSQAIIDEVLRKSSTVVMMVSDKGITFTASPSVIPQSPQGTKPPPCPI